MSRLCYQDEPHRVWPCLSTPPGVSCLPGGIGGGINWTTLGHQRQGVSEQAPGRLPAAGAPWRKEWLALSTPRGILYPGRIHSGKDVNIEIYVCALLSSIFSIGACRDSVGW